MVLKSFVESFHLKQLALLAYKEIFLKTNTSTKGFEDK